MGRNITPEMLKAIQLVESGENRYRAAITAGVRPSSLYARLARYRRLREGQQGQQENQGADQRVS